MVGVSCERVQWVWQGFLLHPLKKLNDKKEMIYCAFNKNYQYNIMEEQLVWVTESLWLQN